MIFSCMYHVHVVDRGWEVRPSFREDESVRGTGKLSLVVSGMHYTWYIAQPVSSAPRLQNSTWHWYVLR